MGWVQRLVAQSRPLFTDTIAEFETWNETPGHAYEGLLNFDQMGLAGHSHGTRS